MAGLLAALPVIGSAVDKLLNLIPDGNARARAEAEYQRVLLDAVTQAEAGQRAVNQTEATHSSIFVAGWRPFVGWVCGAALAYQYLIRPFWVWYSLVYYPDAPLPPALDNALWELIAGMLGLGGLRSLDKIKGVNR